MYYDGANLNAVCGISRPGDMGFDVVHINLHKTFSQPHGGGGPGRRADRRARERSRRTCRCRSSRRDGDGFRLDYDRPKSIGKVRAFSGPFGVFVRSYAFMRAWGPGLREMSEVAVLNANYMLARLKDAYDLPYDRLCMHEFVLRARTLKREHGVSALDVAKRLMDYDFHPPTVYFPLVVPEALMIEPTESEAKETLDAFIDAMLAIAARGRRRPGAAPRRAARPAGAAGSTRCAPRSTRSCASVSRSIRPSRGQATGSSRPKRRLPRTTLGVVLRPEAFDHLRLAGGAGAEGKELDPFRAALEGAGCVRGDADRVPLLDVDHLVADLHPPTAREDHVDLLLVAVLVAERLAKVGHQLW